MKHGTALHRRAFITAVFGGVAAWLGSGAGFFGGGRPRLSEHAALAALCLHLDCPGRFGETCRQALPPAERSEHALARTLMADLRSANSGLLPANGLARAVRQLSRDDFHAGRVAVVGGWMLSLTETRLYALAGLTSPRKGGDGGLSIRTEAAA